jgi:hypothetical protein
MSLARGGNRTQDSAAYSLVTILIELSLLPYLSSRVPNVFLCQHAFHEAQCFSSFGTMHKAESSEA